jgi:hypothetical protein
MNMERRDPEKPSAANGPVPGIAESATPVAAKPAGGRGTFAGEARFLATAVRLAFVVVAEFLYYCLIAVAFLSVAPWYRKRMRRFILRSAGGAVLAFALIVAGCGGREQRTTTETGDSWTFQGQMRQLEWSTKAVIDQSDARESLEDDLHALGPDPNWKDSMMFDIKNLFLMPDGRASLESDLKAFSAPENHGVKETIELWGW